MEKHSVKYWIEHRPDLFPDCCLKWAEKDKNDDLNNQFLYLEDDGIYQRLVFEINKAPSMPIGMLYYTINEITHKLSRLSVVFKLHKKKEN